MSSTNFLILNVKCNSTNEYIFVIAILTTVLLDNGKLDPSEDTAE